MHDFTTLSRSTTLGLPHRQPGHDRPAGPRRCSTDLDTSGGVRLLGVGVSGLADWVQEDLFGETDRRRTDELPEVEVPAPLAAAPGRPAWTSCTPRWAAAGCGARAAAW